MFVSLPWYGWPRGLEALDATVRQHIVIVAVIVILMVVVLARMMRNIM